MDDNTDHTDQNDTSQDATDLDNSQAKREDTKAGEQYPKFQQEEAEDITFGQVFNMLAFGIITIAGFLLALQLIFNS